MTQPELPDSSRPDSSRPDSNRPGSRSSGNLPVNLTKNQLPVTLDQPQPRINPAIGFSVRQYVFSIGIFVAVVLLGVISVPRLGVTCCPTSRCRCWPSRPRTRARPRIRWT